MENRMPRQTKPTDTEKITINIGYVDLGWIDLLVEEGLYTNRTDFIRASIRAQIATHALEMGRLIERRTLDVGLREFRREDLQKARAPDEILRIKVVGLARLASDISLDLAQATIGSINVLGALQATPGSRSIESPDLVVPEGPTPIGGQFFDPSGAREMRACADGTVMWWRRFTHAQFEAIPGEEAGGIIPGAGHLLPEEVPEFLAAELGAFSDAAEAQ
jgi:Arc/MetJ-type ribon-helix-helix transcriptional regulator